MIIGSVVHDGDVALVVHLTNASDNEAVFFESDSLVSRDAFAGLVELRRLASGARTKTPLLHVWASPSRDYLASEWDLFWTTYEAEFALQGQPFFEVCHRKLGKGNRTAGHRHRVYLRVRPDGRAVPMSHSAPRNEKIARIAEVRNGERLTPGVYSRSVVKHLRREGLNDVADAMTRAGIDLVERNSTINASERAEHERTGDIPADLVATHLVRILVSTQSGRELEAALQAIGLRPAQGNKAVGVVTPLGRFYSLARTYNRAARPLGLPPLRAAEVKARFKGVGLPKAQEISNQVPSGDAKAVGSDRRDRRTAGDSRSKEKKVTTDPLVSGVSEPRAGPAGLHDRTEMTPQSINLETLTSRQRAAIEEWKELMFAANVPAPASQKEPRWMVEVSGSNPKSVRSPAAQYKAKLAGLPEDLGSVMRWVDVEGDAATVHLKDGSVVQLETHRAAASAETPEAFAVLVAHAKERSWSHTRVTGGSEPCREALARKLVREGLTPVGDHIVAAAAREERELIFCETGIRRWRLAQRTFLMTKMSSDGPDAGAAVGELFASSHALIKNERSRVLLKADQYSQLAADYRFASGFLGHREPQPGWPDADEPRHEATGRSP